MPKIVSSKDSYERASYAKTAATLIVASGAQVTMPILDDEAPHAVTFPDRRRLRDAIAAAILNASQQTSE